MTRHHLLILLNPFYFLKKHTRTKWFWSEMMNSVTLLLHKCGLGFEPHPPTNAGGPFYHPDQEAIAQESWNISWACMTAATELPSNPCHWCCRGMTVIGGCEEVFRLHSDYRVDPAFNLLAHLLSSPRSHHNPLCQTPGRSWQHLPTPPHKPPQQHLAFFF